MDSNTPISPVKKHDRLLRETLDRTLTPLLVYGLPVLVVVMLCLSVIYPTSIHLGGFEGDPRILTHLSELNLKTSLRRLNLPSNCSKEIDRLIAIQKETWQEMIQRIADDQTKRSGIMGWFKSNAVTVLGILATYIGTVGTVIFGWRNDRRATRRLIIDLEKHQVEQQKRIDELEQSQSGRIIV